MTTPFPFVSGTVLTAQQLNDIQNLPISDKTANYVLVVADVNASATSSNTLSWKFKGIRPVGYPTNRLSQFVVFCHLFKWDFTFFNQDVKSMKDELYAILKSQSKLEFDSLFCKPIYTEIKKDMIDLIIINSFVLFFVFFQKFQGKEMSIENGVQLLEQVNPEKNKLINFWKELGVKFNTAADSQSALEQYNELCSKKKCMVCQISSVIFQQKP